MIKISAKNKIQGKLEIPIEVFPEDIRDLMTDYKKNKDEIIKRMTGRQLYAVMCVDYKDQDGREYIQKFKINILTMEVEKLDEGPLILTTKDENRLERKKGD